MIPQGGHARQAFVLLAIVTVLFGAAWPIMKLGMQAATPFALATGRAALVDLRRRRGRNGIPLLVHHVLRRIVDLDGLERAGADVQQYFRA